MIVREGINAVINDNLTFKNLYGIMVRKVDFVRKKRSDRIIARFPFLILNNELRTKIQERTLLIAEVAQNYFYRSINKSITAWRDIICKYLERGSLPYPLFRCAQEIIPDLSLLVNGSGSIPFMSARGEAFTFPTKVSNQLAYICGVCNGDGNLRDYWIIIADETKAHIEFVKKLLNNLFSKEGKIMKTGGAWIVKLNLLWATRLFNFLTNQAINEPKYDSLGEPVIFQRIEEPFRSLYWRGVFDADGSFKNQIAFSSMSGKYCIDFQNFLTEKTIHSKIFQMKNGGYMLTIPAKEKVAFATIVGVSNCKKRKDFINFLNTSYSYKVFKGFNQKAITKNNYLNFTLLPNMQVLGLETFFQKNEIHKTKVITNKELNRYKRGFGITIKKLKQHLQLDCVEEFMMFLYKFREKIKFRSSNSVIIKLKLKPTETLEEIMFALTPTIRGATFREESNIPLKTISNFFDLKINDNKILHRLLPQYLVTFGVYQEISTNNFNKETLFEKWEKDLFLEEK